MWRNTYQKFSPNYGNDRLSGDEEHTTMIAEADWTMQCLDVHISLATLALVCPTYNLARRAFSIPNLW